MNNSEISDEEVDKFYQKVKKDVEEVGYHLNPDVEFTKELLKNILVNERRYGYGSCPCRLAEGDKELDLDIICPCDHRDPDLNDYDTCYCGLYVTDKILKGEKEIEPIPERRPPLEERIKSEFKPSRESVPAFKVPVWRCRVCGYLSARDQPPEICPICKASKERFERFM